MPVWAWVVIGVAAILAFGAASVLLVGLAGAPSERARRAAHGVGFRRGVRRGQALPDETLEPDRRRRDLAQVDRPDEPDDGEPTPRGEDGDPG